MNYTSNRRLIKYALVSILEAATYDRLGAGTGTLFAVVTADPSQQYNQEPVCVVYRAPSMDTKAEVGVQDQTIGFYVFILLSLENKQRTRQQTQDWMDDLEELTLSVLDQADWQGALNQTNNPPTVKVWKLDAKANVQYPASVQSGRVLACQIDVEVSYSNYLTGNP